MASPILRAISSGYSSRTVLNHISRRFPAYANAINTAQSLGYTTDVILRHLSNRHGKHADTEDDYLTEHEQVQKRDAEQKKRAALGLLSAAGTTGAVAAGIYGYATRNRAVRPSQIISPQRPQGGGPGPTINITPHGRGPQGGALAGPQQQRLPAPHVGPRTTQPQTPIPRQQLIQKTPQQNVDLVRNIKEDTRIRNVIQGMGATQTAIQVLRKVIPKVKLDLLDKVEGGLEQVVSDYSQYLQQEQRNQPPEIRQQTSPQAIQKENQELIQAVSAPPIEQNALQSAAQTEPQQREAGISIKERTQQASFNERPELHRLVDSSFSGKEFSIPNYRYPGESQEDFSNRRIINDAVKKAAKALSEGKSFLDFPVNPEALKGKGGYSVAEDVLRFMAGIPNIYDPLLDEDEKQEIYDGMSQQGAVQGLRPSPGEQNISGAQMTPNLIWNLLLSVEPKLSKIERPPAIKGANAPGEKMDTTGLRRYLTHGVYGILSGKTVSPDLSEKIDKISRASSSVDEIAKAAETGNFNKVLQELERLSNDDAYFFSLFTEEVDEMAGQLGAKGMKIKGSAADTKAANDIKKKLNPEFLNELNEKNLIEKLTPEKVDYLLKLPHNKKAEKALEDWSYELYANDILPGGWYLHGRSGQQELKTNFVVQFSKSWDVAEGYSRKGSMWMAKPKKNSEILNLTSENTKDMDSVVKKAIKSWKEGDFERGLNNKEEVDDYVRRNFAPKRIVETAGAYDDPVDCEWLTNNFKMDFVKTPDGAVAFNIDALDKIKVPT